MARSGGGGGILLVVLLLALGVGGAWNYRRNLDAEAAESPRPYRTLSDAEIEQLITAYEGEIGEWETREGGVRSTTGGVRDRAHFDDRVREFERVQRSGARVRAVGDELRVRQIELEKLEEEQRLRSDSQDVLALHLRRLLTF
jgi:hypothetical protein